MDRIGREQRRSLWFKGMVGVSMLLLVANLLGLDKGRLLGQLDLGGENNIAAWWSGMLLLFAGLHAFDGYVLEKDNRPSAARGWAVISLILVLLSADEIGSIHERVSGILQVGSWLSLLPFAVIMGALFCYGLISLWWAGEPLGTVLLIIFGFSMFALAALQEYIEHFRYIENLKASSPLFYNIRQSLEEGSELLGMLVLLRVSMKNTRGTFSGQKGLGPTFDSVKLLRLPLLSASLLVVPVSAYITALLLDQRRGHPSDWLAASLFILAALSIARNFLKDGEKLHGLELGMIALSCVASVCSVACHPRLKPLLFLAVMVSFLAYAFAAKRPASNRPALILSAVGAGILLSLGLMPSCQALWCKNPFPSSVLLMIYGLPVIASTFSYLVSSGEPPRPSGLTACKPMQL